MLIKTAQELDEEQDKKTLFKVEFWQENREWEPVAVYWVEAKHLEDARNRIKARGMGESRKNRDFKILRLLARNDITVSYTPVVRKKTLKQRLDAIRPELEKGSICQNCGEKLDDDYCQSCGRRRDWFEMAQKTQQEQVELEKDEFGRILKEREKTMNRPTNCPNCGETLDYDYCQSCGYRLKI